LLGRAPLLTEPIRGTRMAKPIRIAPETDKGKSRSVTFVLAIGSIRQTCRLTTNFITQNQASSYLHRHRLQLELAARTQFARGEIEDGVIQLTMV
jgi:hypothetical protein